MTTGAAPVALESLRAPRRDRLRLLALAALTALAVFLGGSLSYALTVKTRVIVWIPSGVAVGLLLWLKPRQWWIVLVGAYLGNAAIDLVYVRSIPLSLLGPAANVAESLVAATVVRWMAGTANILTTVRGVTALILGAAVLSNALTALLGGALLSAWYRGPFATAWLDWWIGDGLGMVLVAPAVLGGLAGMGNLRHEAPPWHRAAEGVLLSVAVAWVAVWVFDQPPSADRFLGSTYLVFPPLIWMAIRTGAGAAAGALCLLAGVALWYSALGLGPLIDPTVSRPAEMANLYAFLGLGALSVLVPAAAIGEREQALARVRSSEARYRALVESARDAIITAGADGRIRFTNPAADRLFGLAAGAAVGRPVTSLLRAEDTSALEALFGGRSSHASPDAWNEFELRARGADGRELPVEVTVAEWSADGERMFTGIVRDLTERRKLEEELRHARQLESLGRLTGGVAHEFRNQLTVISMNAEVALTGPMDRDEQQAALVEIREAARRGATITGQLLAFGRRQVLDPVRLDLDEAVERAVATLRPLVSNRMEIAFGKRGSVKPVRVDATALQQVLLNLLLNARDATSDGGRVEVRTSLVEVDAPTATSLGLSGAGRYALIEVADTGKGMDAATLERIFEPFFTTKSGGTGLGLAAVYGLVRQSQGAVIAESAPGSGTTFRVYLPVAPSDSAASAVAASA